MHPDFLRFGLTPLYNSCPHLKGNLIINEKNQISIIIDHHDIKEFHILPPTARPYLWCIWGNSSLPLLSGIARTRNEAINIAHEFGLRGICANKKNIINEQLSIYAKHTGAIVSKIKRKNGYVLAVWNSCISYLVNEEPILFLRQVNEESLRKLILKYGDGNPFASEFKSDFILNYIRRREAQRKLLHATHNHKSSNLAYKIEFVHADHNESEYTGKKNWQRHRIIKITDKHIFIDAYPFYGRSYLRQGWRSRIIYMRTLDRLMFERDHLYYHRTLRTTFYSESYVKKRRWRCKLNDQDDNMVIELPTNDLDWSIKQLDIKEWPTTIKEIKRAFAKKALENHPDRGGDATKFIQCKAAREFLLDMST